MSDEPRFPPPHGQEPVGYREAGAPQSDDKPELPIPSGPVAPHHKRVVASRPDDPEVALAKTYTTPRRTPTQQAGLGGGIVILLLVVAYFYLQIAHCR